MAKDAKKTVTLEQLSAVATKVKTWGKNNFVEDVKLTSGKIQKVVNGTATDVVTIPTSLPNPNSLKLQAGGTDKVTYDGSSSATLNIASGSGNGTISVGGTDVSVTGLGSLAYLNSLSASDVSALPSTTKYAGSSTAGGAATSAAKLTNTSKVGDTNKPVYFTAQGVPAAVTHTLNADVPEGAVFTDTHYTATPVVGGSSATSNATSDTDDPYINIVENGSKSGGVRVKGTGATSVSAKNGIITVNSTNTTYDEVTTTTAGLMSAADKVKLNGIAAGAEVNVQSDWNATSGDAFIKNKPTIPDSFQWFGTSSTAADTVQKEVSIPSITSLKAGQLIIVLPTVTSTVANSTLKLNSFDAYPMRYGNAAITTSTDSIVWSANYPSVFVFDGSYWIFLTHGYDSNTTYSAMSVAEGTTGTKTTARSISAASLKEIIDARGYTTNEGTITGIKMNGASMGTSGVVDLGTVITDISGKVDNTTTVNGHALSSNVTVTKSDVGLGNVGNFKAVSTVASQDLTDTEKSNARANIGAGTSSFSGSYNDLSNKPTIPAAAANGTYTVKTLVGSTTTNVSDFTANQSSADDVTFVQGSNVTITPDATNRKITIAATDTTYESKAASANGTDLSLVTTGEKAAWNAKTSNMGTVTKVSTGAGLTGGDVTTTGTIKANLTSETKLTNASSDGTETSGRVYPVRLDKNGKLAVNVPWSYTNTATLQVSDTENKKINTSETTGSYLQFTAGTNKFTVSDGTSSFDVAVTPSITNNVTGSSLTADKIVLGNGSSAVKTSSKGITTTAPSSSSDDTTLPTSKAVWEAIGNGIATNDAMVYKGTIAGGSTGTYGALTSAANKGYTYKVSTAGKINGVAVEVGDMLICNTDSTAAATSSNYSTIAAKWDVIQANIDGAVTGPANSTDDNLAAFNGTGGKVIKDSGLTTTNVSDAVTKKHSHSSLTLSTTAQAYDGTHTLALPSSDPYSSARTPASHTHGNIANGGTLTDTAAAAAGNDYIVIRDAENAKIQTSTIKGTDVATAVSKVHDHETLTLSTTAQAYDGTHTLALPASDPYTSARTPASHTHGNITNSGALQTTDITIANGDKLVVTDSSDSNKIARASISFDGSTTTQALTKKGTFETFASTSLFGSSADGLAPSTASGNVTTAETSSTVKYLCSDGKWRPLPAGAWKEGTLTTNTHKITVISGKKSDGSTDITATSASAAATPSVTLGDSGVTANSYGDSSAQTPSYGGTFKVPYITVNAKGIVTGLSEHNVTIPASDNTDRYVNSAAFADNTSSDANNPVKMTLTRAGSDTATVTGNLPKVSSSSAGVAPKGAAVSSQSQTTKFLREDGTWAAPSYTTNTNTATAADNILDGSNSGTQITYAPYSTQQSKLSFDTSSTAPSRTDRLNLNGHLYATKLYSGGTEVITDISGKQNKVAALGSSTQPVYTSAAGTFAACSTYAGGTAVTLNGTSKAADTASFYAPTEVGTSGQVLLSTGNGAPGWKTGDIIHYVTSPSGTAGTKSKNRAQWSGTVDGVTSLYTGLMILIKVPVAGVNVGISLNINSFGEHPVILNASTLLSTHFPVNSILPLVYDADQTASLTVNETSTSYTGCWKFANYDSNTTYSAGTAALLTEGTNTTNRVWPASILASYVTSTAAATASPANGGNADTVDNIHIMKITQSDYDTLDTKDENTLYIITT